MSSNLQKQKKKAIIYKENDFGFISEIKKLNISISKVSIGILFGFLELRCGFKFDISISITRKIVLEDCSKCCRCCGVSVSSFSHWIFSCKELENYRNNSLPFLDDLFLKFAMIIEQKILGCFFRFRKRIMIIIFIIIILGVCSICEKIKVNDKEKRQLVDNIFLNKVQLRRLFRILWGLRSF